MNASTGSRRARWMLLATVSLVILVAVGGPAASQELPGTASPAKEGRVGDVVVVDSSGNPLDEGGSATEFSLELPDGAACPGDSATGNWRVQSFLTPATDDPGALTYKSTKPEGEGRWALYALDTRSYINHLTSIAAEEGGPGIIDERPVFNFVLFPPGTLPDGTYELGIACTLWNVTYRYWDTEITLTNTDADEPAELVWETAGASAASDSSSSSSSGPIVIGIAIIGAVGLIAAVVIHRGRRARPLMTPQEER